MNNKFLDGIKFGFGFMIAIFLISGLAYAGYHGASQVMSGTFGGDYNYTGTVDFTLATVVGMDADTVDSYHLNQNVLTTSSPTFVNLNSISGIYGDFGTIARSYDEWLRLNDGATHTNGIYTSSHFRADGEIRQGNSDYGAYEIQTPGQIYVNDYVVAMGGVHVGGTSDPGTDNLAVDGNIVVNGAITAPEGTLRDNGGGWVRTYGATGWYSQTYGGGWYMSDTTYIRAYGDKTIYTAGNIQAGGSFVGIEPYSTRQTASCSTSGCTTTATCPAGYKVVAGNIARDTINCIYGAKWCERYCTPGGTSCSATSIASQASVNIFCMKIY